MSNLLGLNIDHIATLRNLRGTMYPDLVHAVLIAEQSGVHSITMHLREDRRHITDNDVKLLRKVIKKKYMNLEMAMTEEMVGIACVLKPDYCCLVPERREELTTEGGLNVIDCLDKLHSIVLRLVQSGIRVSLFIDPDEHQIFAAYNSGVSCIELHTGAYANATEKDIQILEYERIKKSIACAVGYGLQVNVGHGLNYHNVQIIAALPNIQELNIGHSIICRAVFSGLSQAILDMKLILKGARGSL